jgi:peptide methionine sulfoxide reductase msrA/msrB
MSKAGTFLGIVFLLLLWGGIIMDTDKEQSTSARENGRRVKLNKLTPAEKRVIIYKGTEPPFSGKYWDYDKPGLYVCRQCGALLYRSEDKFKSKCGWPSFDDQMPNAIKEVPDADGARTEIVCKRCGGHLGHIFHGERLTPKNARHCVNSISMDFIPADSEKVQRAIFAGGCFWGVEYYFQEVPGVLATVVGYTGGKKDFPTYREVCGDISGHAEAVEVFYDPQKTTYEKLVEAFLKIHDPTQLNRQGPDIGEQYRSAIFYINDKQKKTAEKLLNALKAKGVKVVTKVEPAKRFWPAEEYHQNWYRKKGTKPYCHTPPK